MHFFVSVSYNDSNCFKSKKISSPFVVSVSNISRLFKYFIILMPCIFSTTFSFASPSRNLDYLLERVRAVSFIK